MTTKRSEPFLSDGASPAAWRDEVRQCTACHLHEQCALPVPGYGPAEPEIVFVGRNPGRTEDVENVPFVGKAGQEYLEPILGKLGLAREEVWITNAVKCWKTEPKPNANPNKSEVLFCAERWLLPEIARLRCRLVVTFGLEAFQAVTVYLSGTKRLGDVAGKPKRLDRWVAGETGYLFGEMEGPRITDPGDMSKVVVLPMRHPAGLMYPGGRKHIPDFWEDVDRMVSLYKKIRSKFGGMVY